MLSKYSGNLLHFNLTMKAGVLFWWEIDFFSDKTNLKTVSEPFTFPRYTGNFGKQPTEYISKRASQQAGGDLFSLQWNAEKISWLLKYQYVFPLWILHGVTPTCHRVLQTLFFLNLENNAISSFFQLLFEPF